MLAALSAQNITTVSNLLLCRRWNRDRPTAEKADNLTVEVFLQSFGSWLESALLIMWKRPESRPVCLTIKYPTRRWWVERVRMYKMIQWAGSEMI